MKEKQIAITERDRHVIKWIANLNDTELFGLECFLAGARVATFENQIDSQDSYKLESSNKNG